MTVGAIEIAQFVYWAINILVPTHFVWRSEY